MADFLLHLVRAQIAASALILVVLAVRRFVRGMVGARIAYALWLLPLVGATAVLLPARISYATQPPAVAAPGAPSAQMSPSFVAAAPVHAVDLQAPTPKAPVNPWPAVLAVWAAGVLASLAWLIIQQIRYLGYVRAGAVGPAVVGFWRPRVVLPLDFEECYSEAERALIIAHEAAHLRRNDARVIGVALLLRSLGWFNPLIYVAMDKLRVDQELACDETVVSTFPGARRAYAAALTKSQLAVRPLPLGCYWPSGSEHPLLERIAMLRVTPIGGPARMAGVGVIAVLSAATGLGAWGATPAQVRYVSEQLAATPMMQALSPLRPAERSPVIAQPAQPATAEPQPQTPLTPQDQQSALAGAIASGDARGIVLAGGEARDVLDAILSNGEMDTMGEPMGEPFNVVPGQPVRYVTGPGGALGVAFDAVTADGRRVPKILAPPEISDLAHPPDAISVYAAGADPGERLAQLADASRPRFLTSGTPP